MAAMAELSVDDGGEEGQFGAGNGRGCQGESEELELVLLRGFEGRRLRVAMRQPWPTKMTTAMHSVAIYRS